jgi:hypothetical protein
MAQKPMYPMNPEHWFWLLPYCTMFADMEHTLICKRLFKKKNANIWNSDVGTTRQQSYEFPSGLWIRITIMRIRIKFFQFNAVQDPAPNQGDANQRPLA